MLQVVAASGRGRFQTWPTAGFRFTGLFRDLSPKLTDKYCEYTLTASALIRALFSSYRSLTLYVARVGP